MTPEAYAAGASLQKARGHEFTPEHGEVKHVHAHNGTREQWVAYARGDVPPDASTVKKALSYVKTPVVAIAANGTIGVIDVPDTREDSRYQPAATVKASDEEPFESFLEDVWGGGTADKAQLRRGIDEHTHKVGRNTYFDLTAYCNQFCPPAGGVWVDVQEITFSPAAKGTR